MSGPDVALRADADYYRARDRGRGLGPMDPWWRVLDAECLWPAINSETAVSGLREGVK